MEILKMVRGSLTGETLKQRWWGREEVMQLSGEEGSRWRAVKCLGRDMLACFKNSIKAWGRVGKSGSGMGTGRGVRSQIM